MSPLEAKIRRDLLRDVLRSVRHCWASLATGDIAGAEDHRNAATRTLAFTNGLYARHGVIGATCRLERSLIELGMALDAALAVSLRGPAVHPSELVPHLFESLKVLQREGVQVEDDQLLARARNAATALSLAFRFEALP